jgi:FYVE, RhoGEF and PH domain containing 5/6
MAFDQNMPKRALTRIDDIVDNNVGARDLSAEDRCKQGESMLPVVQVRPASRPRSFLRVLENFQEAKLQITPSPSTSHFSPQTGGSADVSISPHSDLLLSNDSGAPSLISLPSAAMSPTTSSASRIEDTVRRQKRFSLPIVGIQTTPVTARANPKGEGLAKRFSLVLGGGRTIRGSKSTRPHGKSLDQEAGEGTVRQSRSTGHGIAATRLADLLGRRKSP